MTQGGFTKASDEDIEGFWTENIRDFLGGG